MDPVRIVAKNPPVDLKIPMGGGPAYPVGGLGGWTTVSLQDEVEGSDWEGQEPLREDVPLLLDGLEDRDPVTKQWQTVKSLGRPGPDRQKPPPFQVFGPIDAPQGKWWVLPSGGIEVVNAEDELIKNAEGAILRIEFVLHLQEYIPPEEIKAKKRRRGKVAIGNAKVVQAPLRGGVRVVTKPGDTLQKVAARELGDWNRWPQLAQSSGVKSPFEELPEGIDLLIGGPGQSAGRTRLILYDYHRFATWSERHGLSEHPGSGEWFANLQAYAGNQGVSTGLLESLHGATGIGGDPSDDWRARWNDGER